MTSDEEDKIIKDYGKRIDDLEHKLTRDQLDAYLIDEYCVGEIALAPYRLWHHAVLLRQENALLQGKPVRLDWLKFLTVCHALSERNMKRSEYEQIVSLVTEEYIKWDNNSQLARRFGDTMEYYMTAMRDANFSIGGEDAKPAPRLRVSYVTRVINLIAGAYGWTEEYILNLPMARVHQITRAIVHGNAVSNGMDYEDDAREVLALYKERNLKLNPQCDPKNTDG